jgi:ferredoxin-NADP reductase
MEMLENIFMILGVALCVFALLPLGLWTAQSLSVLAHNRKQFAISQEVMRQQILQAAANRTSAPEPVTAVTALDSVDAASTLLQEPSGSDPAPPEAQPPTKNVCEVAADGSWSGTRQFQVAKLVSETETCTSVYLVPQDGQPIATFEPGQHLSLKFDIPGQSKPVYRCYSLSDGPGKPYYRISVKQMLPATPDGAPGLVSSFVNQQLVVGDVIEARSPAGSFKLDAEDVRPVVMLGGGIGVTPMISMIETLTTRFPDRTAILVYGVRNKADQAFSDYLNQQSAAHKNLHVINCFSEPNEADQQGVDYQVKGFASVSLLKQLLPHKDCQFYLCGPPPFMKSLSEGLAEWGVPDTQVFSETFGPAAIKRPKVNEGASPKVPAVPVTLSLTGKTVEWSDEFQSLLDLAEAKGVDIPFGCRAGSCGTCATRIISGEIDYPEGQTVDCEPGECLTCVARPIGPVELGA